MSCLQRSRGFDLKWVGLTKNPSEPRRVLPAERDDDLTLGDACKETGHGREDRQNPADDRSRVDTCGSHMKERRQSAQ